MRTAHCADPSGYCEPSGGLAFSLHLSREDLLDRIRVDPNICFGKPTIRGHRIWVSLILDYLAGGATMAELLEGYPSLEEADVLACIAYGAEMSRERYFEIPVTADS